MLPFSLGPLEMIAIFLVVLLLFGAKRLPEIGTSLGKGIREFKSSLREVQSSVSADKELPAPREELSGSEGSQDESSPRRLTTG